MVSLLNSAALDRFIENSDRDVAGPLVNGVTGNIFQRFSTESLACEMFQLALAAGTVKTVDNEVEIGPGSDRSRVPLASSNAPGRWSR